MMKACSPTPAVVIRNLPSSLFYERDPWSAALDRPAPVTAAATAVLSTTQQATVPDAWTQALNPTPAATTAARQAGAPPDPWAAGIAALRRELGR